MSIELDKIDESIANIDRLLLKDLSKEQLIEKVIELENKNMKLEQENHYLKSVNSFSKRELYKMNKDRLDANSRLVKENKRLKERVEYLERSNNRREETIKSLRDELIEKEEENQQLKETYKTIDEAMSKLMEENRQLKEQLELYDNGVIYDSRVDKLESVLDEIREYISNKKAIINTDYIRIFDLFEIDEQGYISDLLQILDKVEK